MPGSKSIFAGCPPVLKMVSFKGILCETFVKLPDALSGGISENCDAVLFPN
jgi:hypothetical protein